MTKQFHFSLASRPLLLYTPRGAVAQRLEQGTHNPLVAGSNPAGPSTKKRTISVRFFVLYSGGARTKFESGRRPRLAARAASGKPAWTNSSAVCPVRGEGAWGEPESTPPALLLKAAFLKLRECSLFFVYVLIFRLSKRPDFALSYSPGTLKDWGRGIQQTPILMQRHNDEWIG